LTRTFDATLANLSLAAYSDAPVALPAGFTPLTPSNFNLPLAPGETFSNGLFKSGNGAALLTFSFVEGIPTIVVAFRGSDDAVDSQQDLNNINEAYGSFGSLIAAVDQAAAAWGSQVIVTGHSLGGAMAQIYMANHPEDPGVPGRAAVTFGSPGAILPPGEDGRIVNYVMADDPAVVLGAQRAGIGEILRSDPVLADLAAQRISEELPGMTKEQALASLPNLIVNYDNRGDIVLLPTDDGRLDREGVVAGLAQGDPARHEPELYVAEVSDAWSAPGQSRIVPATPTADEELTFLHALYDGDGRNPEAARTVLGELARDWAAGVADGLRADAGDLIDQAQDGLNGFLQDAQLI
jgi:hypothetical protein